MIVKNLQKLVVFKLYNLLNICRTNLPKINREDPMAKFIGAKPNQIIKIL